MQQNKLAMKVTVQKKWIMISILGLTHWFFGNLYEAIVFSPNWIIDSPLQIKRLNEFFIATSPTLYFVPLSQFATILVWFVYLKNKEKSIKKELKLASVYVFVATIFNIIIVTTTALKLFETEYAQYGNYLSTLTWRWNILNIFRMGLVAISIYFMFQSFRKLDWLTKKNDGFNVAG